MTPTVSRRLLNGIPHWGVDAGCLFFSFIDKVDAEEAILRWNETVRNVFEGYAIEDCPAAPEEDGGISAADQAWLDDCFTYHAPTAEKTKALADVTWAGKDFAAVILLVVPPSADRSAALRCLREARMWANAAIVLDGRR